MRCRLRLEILVSWMAKQECGLQAGVQNYHRCELREGNPMGIVKHDDMLLQALNDIQIHGSIVITYYKS